jgi:hypothetical protein
MGSQPWMYVVPYQADLQAALDALKEREFQAGRYFPAIEDFLTSYVHPEGMEGPGAQHASIEEALGATDACGTQSVLDMIWIGATPALQTVVPMTSAASMSFFGTDRPTREMVESNYAWIEDIGRGEGVAIVIHSETGAPEGIYFAGYSFD